MFSPLQWPTYEAVMFLFCILQVPLLRMKVKTLFIDLPGLSPQMCLNAQVTLRWKRYWQPTSPFFFFFSLWKGTQECLYWSGTATAFTTPARDVLKIKLMHTLVKVLKVRWTVALAGWYSLLFALHELRALFFIIRRAKSSWFVLSCGIIFLKSMYYSGIDWLLMITSKTYRKVHLNAFCWRWHEESKRPSGTRIWCLLWMNAFFFLFSFSFRC